LTVPPKGNLGSNRGGGFFCVKIPGGNGKKDHRICVLTEMTPRQGGGRKKVDERGITAKDQASFVRQKKCGPLWGAAPPPRGRGKKGFLSGPGWGPPNYRRRQHTISHHSNPPTGFTDAVINTLVLREKKGTKITKAPSSKKLKKRKSGDPKYCNCYFEGDKSRGREK